MYVKPTINKKYKFGKYNQYKNNNNSISDINNFSLEIKPAKNRDVKRKEFKILI